MASDGSIIIDTGLDNDGFQHDEKLLKRAIDGLVNTVNNFGSNAAKAFSKVIPMIRQLAASTEDVNNTMQDTSQISAVGDFTKDVRSAESEANRLSNQFTRLGDSLAMGLKTDAQMQRFTIHLSHACDAAQQLTSKVYELKNQKIPTEEYQRITSEVKKAESALFRLYDKQDALHNDDSISETSKEWIRLQKQIARAESKVEQYEAVQHQMEQNGSAFVSGADTQEVSALTSKLQALQQKLSEYEQTAAGFDKLSAPAARSTSSVNTLRSSMSKAASIAGKLVKQFAKMALSKVANGFKNVVGRIKSFVSNGKNVKLTANGITKSLLKLKNMLISRVKESLITQIFNQAKESLQMLALFSDRFNASMSNITNRTKELSANISVSLGNLINAVTPTLTAILNLASKAFTYLNSFCAMLSGQNTVIVAKKQTASYADSLKDTSNSASDTADSVAELNEQLYGFDEITKQTATDATSFDSSTGTNADVLDGSDLFQTVAIQSVVPEQVKKYFDALKNAVKNGDWYGVGAIAAEGLNQAVSTADAYINGTLTPKIVGWVQNATDALNGFVDNFDWHNAGVLIGDTLNGIALAFDTFFTSFHSEEFGSGIAESINGFFDSVDWTQLGKTVGDGLNSILSFFLGFSESLHYGDIGKSIADGVNGIFDTIDWETAGDLVSSGLNGISDLLYGFASTVQWSKIAADLSTFFNTALEGWEPEKTARAIMTTINGAIQFLTTMLKEIKWGTLVTKMLDFLKSALEEFDWEGAGDFLSALVDAVIEIANTLLEYDWDELVTILGDGIGRMLAEIDWLDIIGGLFELAGNLIYTFLTQKLTKWEFISSLLSGFFESVGLDSVAGFFDGISEKLKDMKQFIKDTLFSPVVDWVKELFGIHSPSTVFAEIGGFLMEGMKKGVSDKLESVLRKFSSAKSSIVSVFNDVKSKLKTKFSDALDGVKSTWNSAKTHFSGVKDDIVSAFSGIGTEFYNKFIDAWNTVAGIDWFSLGDNILGGILSGLSNIGSSIAAWGDTFVQGVKDFFDIHSPSRLFRNEVGYYLGAGIAVGMEDAAKLVGAAADDLSGTMMSKLRKIDVQPTIRMPNTSALRNIANTYAAPSVLNAMPQHTKAKIARGETIVPSGASQAQSDAILNKLDVLIAAIRGGSDNAGSPQTETRLVLELDGREMTNAVVRQINMITRATGKSPLKA